jgi:hypothetical protein
VGRAGKGRGEYRMLVGKPKGRIPLGRPMLVWEKSIKIYRDKKRVAWARLKWFWVRSSGGLLCKLQ